MHILLIEDNLDDVLLIEETLWQTARVENRQTLSSGLDRLDQGDIDITLLDLGLPDSQGLNTLRQVMSHNPGIPTVVLTGLEDESLGNQAIHEGAQDYLVKAKVVQDLLKKTLEYAIERHQIIRELERREARFRQIIEQHIDGIFIVNAAGIVRLVNPAAEAIFGRRAAELIGKPFGIPLEVGNTKELVLLHPDQNLIHIEVRVTETEWEDETIYLASLRRVTDRSRLENQLTYVRSQVGRMNTMRTLARDTVDQLKALLYKTESLVQQSQVNPIVAESPLQHLESIQQDLDHAREMLDSILAYLAEDRSEQRVSPIGPLI